MKDNFLNTGVFYEQLALDYFLAHIFREEDYYYIMLRYKQLINNAPWRFVVRESEHINDKEAYDKDGSVTIPPSDQQLIVEPKPADIDITEDDESIAHSADDIKLEIFTRIMLKNGHYLVRIELNGYRLYREFHIEINPANTIVVNCFEYGIDF